MTLNLMALGAELPSKKYLNLAAMKTMVAAAEAKAQELHVEVTICIVDESGNLLFLQKADSASLNTIQWAQRKARHAAFYKSPSKDAEDTVKKGNMSALAYPEFFPNQGGLPIIVDGQILGGIAASGAKSEIDEAVAQAGVDALNGPFQEFEIVGEGEGTIDESYLVGIETWDAGEQQDAGRIASRSLQAWSQGVTCVIFRGDQDDASLWAGCAVGHGQS